MVPCNALYGVDCPMSAWISSQRTTASIRQDWVFHGAIQAELNVELRVDLC